MSTLCVLHCAYVVAFCRFSSVDIPQLLPNYALSASYRQCACSYSPLSIDPQRSSSLPSILFSVYRSFSYFSFFYFTLIFSFHLRSTSHFLFFLLRDPTRLSEWAAAALVHPIGVCLLSHRKRYLFSLMAEHIGFEDDYEVYDTDDELPEDDSAESFIVEYPNDNLLKNLRKAPNKKNRKDSQMGIGQFLSQELDLNSVRKDRIRCTQEMWDLVLLVATMRDNQARGFKRYVPRAGSQFQVGEIPACPKRRKKVPEREIIFTRKRKASLTPDLPLEAPKSNPGESSSSLDVIKNVIIDQNVKVESPGPRIEVAPVAWAEDCRFQPSYLRYAEWSSREKRDLERKRKRKEVHSSDTQKKRGHVGSAGRKESKIAVDTAKPVESVCVADVDSGEGKKDHIDIEVANADLIDEYLMDVSLLSEEFVDSGFLLRAPLSLATRGPSEPRPIENTDRMHDGTLKLTLCSVVRVFQLSEGDSRRRYSLLLQGALIAAPEVSGTGLGSGLGPSDPNPSVALTPVLPNTGGQIAPSTTAPLVSSSSSASASSLLTSPLPADNTLPISTMRPKARAPSFSYSCDAVEPVPTPVQKTEVRIRKMPICTGSTVAATAVYPAVPLRPSAALVHFAKSPTSGSAVASASGGAPVACANLGQGSELGRIHRWVEVSDGTAASRAIVPLRVCRFSLVTPERALSALHRAKYCTATALTALRSDLIAESSSRRAIPGPSSISSSTLPSAMPVEKNNSDTVDLRSGIPPKSDLGSKLRVSSASVEDQSSEEECDEESEQQKWSETDIALFVRGKKRYDTDAGSRTLVTS
jgi:hypothetical protein